VGEKRSEEMAISVQPVDGLITRLLQQNTRSTAGKRPSQSGQHGSASQDTVRISSQAKASPESFTQTNIHQHQAGEKALESHLLNLYKTHDNYGG